MAATTDAAVIDPARHRQLRADATPIPLPWPVAALAIGSLSAGLWLGIFRLVAALL